MTMETVRAAAAEVRQLAQESRLYPVVDRDMFEDLASEFATYDEYNTHARGLAQALRQTREALKTAWNAALAAGPTEAERQELAKYVGL